MFGMRTTGLDDIMIMLMSIQKRGSQSWSEELRGAGTSEEITHDIFGIKLPSHPIY